MSRFAEPQDAAFRRLNDSIGFDWRLSPYDVDQSIAHAAMLAADYVCVSDTGAAGDRTQSIDITGRDEIAELARAFDAMTQKLDARARYIGDFAANVSHEFKSPLTSRLPASGWEQRSSPSTADATTSSPTIASSTTAPGA